MHAWLRNPEPAASIKSKIKCSTKGDRNWRHIAIILGRLTLLFGKPRRCGESQNKYILDSSLVDLGLHAGIRQLAS